MFYLRNLRVRLQERRNRLYKTTYRTYDTELRYLFQFLNEETYIRSLVSVLELSTSVDFQQWTTDQNTAREVKFPASEEGRAKVCYGILKECANGVDDHQTFNWAHTFSSQDDFNAKFREFTETVVDPFINFLHDKIDDRSNILYLIERFKQKAEWFRREELYDLYLRDTRVGEARLDAELRASLFDGGVDYPFSQPASPSGRADIVALLGSDDPLVLEVKVFDPAKSKDKGHLRQGFHQVSRYANDYNQSLGYLVIFNCSDRQLVISSEDTSEAEFAPRIMHGGKTFFAISIDIHPGTTSASKEKPTSRLTIGYKELIGD